MEELYQEIFILKDCTVYNTDIQQLTHEQELKVFLKWVVGVQVQVMVRVKVNYAVINVKLTVKVKRQSNFCFVQICHQDD